MKKAVAAAVIIAAAALVWRAARRAPPAALSGKVAVLNELLESGNDNDPRLDRDFNALTPEDRAAFRRRYAELAPEKRNPRGTIVYLLGRNAPSAEDWEFFRQVAGEACLSLADCAKAGGESKGPGDDVTLAYPSLVALKQAQAALEQGRDADAARRVIAAAKVSKMPAVLRLAAKLDRQFPKP